MDAVKKLKDNLQASKVRDIIPNVFPRNWSANAHNAKNKYFKDSLTHKIHKLQIFIMESVLKL